MTVISAPRIIPRRVSSLISPRAAVSARLAILFSLEIAAAAGGRRGRVAADRLPAAVVLDRYVREHDAILDHPPEVFEAPAGMDGSDHHVRQHRRILKLDVDVEHVAALDGVEPFVPGHHERPARAGPDQHEIPMHKRLQPLHILAAEGVAPLTLKPFNHRRFSISHYLVTLPPPS